MDIKFSAIWNNVSVYIRYHWHAVKIRLLCTVNDSGVTACFKTLPQHLSRGKKNCVSYLK